MDLLGSLGGGIWSAVFFVIALSVIVAIHEYGHYIVGRWTGIHAEVFSLGFGPVLLSRVDKRGTKWQVAAIPFGGYVKFLGDADASSVRAEVPAGLSPEERRHTMAGAPVWARALTVAAGPFANFLLTLVVLTGMLLYTGVLTDNPTVQNLVPLPQEQTLRSGDKIIAMDGTPTPDSEAFGTVAAGLPRSAQISFTVERDGQQIEIQAPHPFPARISTVTPNSAAVDAGLRSGDVITRAAGQEIVTFTDLQGVVFGSGGEPVPLTVWRDGQVLDLILTPRQRDVPKPDGTGFETQWMIGVAQGLAFEMGTRAPTAYELLTVPATQTWAWVTTTFSGLYHMATGGISTCNMSGVVGMAGALGDTAKAGLQDFIAMVAVISLGVGLLNLFPIPVLDGGHLVFHAYEAVTGKPPSDGALRILMSTGLTLLLALMAFALLQDFTCI